MFDAKSKMGIGIKRELIFTCTPSLGIRYCILLFSCWINAIGDRDVKIAWFYCDIRAVPGSRFLYQNISLRGSVGGLRLKDVPQ